MKLSYIIIGVFLTLSFFYAEAPNFKVRNVEFGMSMDQVLKSEKEEPSQNEADSLAYIVSLNNHEYNLVYYFIDDKLYQVLYSFNEELANNNNYIDVYNDMKTKLSSKYGTALIDKQSWKDDIFKNDPDNYGLAIASGHLSYLAEWDTNSIQIGLLLSGEKYKINFFIMYSETNLAKMAQDRENKKEENNY